MYFCASNELGTSLKEDQRRKRNIRQRLRFEIGVLEREGTK